MTSQLCEIGETEEGQSGELSSGHRHVDGMKDGLGDVLPGDSSG